LTDLEDVQRATEQAAALLGANVLSRLCRVTKPTIRRYTLGITKPTPENAARIRFALALGILLEYRYNSRVASTFFKVANPSLGYYIPVAILAKHPPGSDAWDQVGDACADFLFGYERSDNFTPSSTHRDGKWPPLDMS
jgi:hypothetical protein